MAVKIEVRTNALRRQQMILTVLGYYKGSCDGIWSKASIEAMRKFEASGKFAPALPRNGLPLDLYSKMPPGIFRDSVTANVGAGLLTCIGLDRAKIEELTPNSNTDTSGVLTGGQGAEGANTPPASSEGSAGEDGSVGETDTTSNTSEVEFANIGTNQMTKKERKALARQKHLDAQA